LGGGADGSMDECMNGGKNWFKGLLITQSKNGWD
jgi:hypothetical protein